MTPTLEPAEQAPDLGAVRAALAAANGFEVAWLEALRRGSLPRDMIARRSEDAFVKGAAVAAAVVVLPALLLSVLPRGPDGGLWRVVLGVAFGVLSVLVPAVFVVRARRAARAGRVGVVEGEVRVVEHEPRPGVRARAYAIGPGLRFEVSEAGARAVVEGLTYRVYYLDDGRGGPPGRLLAVEPIGR
jgi:hypothetical protein